MALLPTGAGSRRGGFGVADLSVRAVEFGLPQVKRRRRIELDWLIGLLVFGGILVFYSVLISFMGGFAGAIAGGGREDRSIIANLGIGFVGGLVGSAIVAAREGEWPEELSGELLVLSFLASIGFALLLNLRDRRKKDPGDPGLPV